MYIKSDTRRSWVEIDLGKIASNYRIYRSHMAEGCLLMPVVKADAYGHGDVAVSTMLQKMGAECFAVSNIDEAKTLRESGISGDILILGYTPPECAEELFRFEITQTLLSEEYAEEISRKGFRIKCQFAIDTGMNRIGLSSDDPEGCERAIRHYGSKLELTGIFTHLSVADGMDEESISFTRAQLDSFAKISERISDMKLRYIHCMNSAGGLCYGGNVVRLGIMMYGLYPAPPVKPMEGIEPALSWKTVVSMVKTIGSGESVGYGRTFTADREMRIATLPTGYADGYRRDLSGRGYVLINGKKAYVVGRICMDQMMVDVTHVDCKMGDEVILIGRDGAEAITADNIAAMIDTIGYEIICGISKRVPRNYID